MSLFTILDDSQFESQSASPQGAALYNINNLQKLIAATAKGHFGLKEVISDEASKTGWSRVKNGPRICVPTGCPPLFWGHIGDTKMEGCGKANSLKILKKGWLGD
jgi:hypothetical protein